MFIFCKLLYLLHLCNCCPYPLELTQAFYLSLEIGISCIDCVQQSMFYLIAETGFSLQNVVFKLEFLFKL
jgi:hypothetical protein